jgi:signal transduction histidine kinase
MPWLWLFLALVIVLMMWNKRREGLTSNDPYELSQMQQGKLEILQGKLNSLTMDQAEINELQRKVNKNADNVVQTQKEMARKDPNKKPYAYPDE